MIKVCTKCKKDKEATLVFFPAHKKTTDGLTSWCRSCNVLYTKQWKINNKDREKNNRRRNSLFTLYGISIEQYDNMLKSQNYGCGICRRPDTGSNRCLFFHVDHCHETGKVRGLLCNNCNRGLGYLTDKVETLKEAIGYLEKNNGNS